MNKDWRTKRTRSWRFADGQQSKKRLLHAKPSSIVQRKRGQEVLSFTLTLKKSTKASWTSGLCLARRCVRICTTPDITLLLDEGTGEELREPAFLAPGWDELSPLARSFWWKPFTPLRNRAGTKDEENIPLCKGTTEIPKQWQIICNAQTWWSRTKSSIISH